MKPLTLLFLFLLPFSPALAQQTAEWLQKLENPEFPSSQLKSENALANYMAHDFSELLIPKTQVLGYIDADYRRIKVEFTSVRKSKTLQNVYYVSGSTIVSNNKCDFEGTITFEQIRELKQLHYGVDDEFKNKGIKAQGVAIGRYRFAENPAQKHVGMFDGVMTLWWYLDKNGKIQYDDLEKHSDQYRNNQYVGTWTEYGKQKSSPCNWGEYRIPFSGDLDIGAGEFSVNPKYYDKGWAELGKQ